VIDVQSAVNMFIVVVQLMSTCTDLVSAVSEGVDVGTRSDLCARVIVCVVIGVSGCGCSRDSERAFEGLRGVRLSGMDDFGLEVFASFCASM
jgi:hypothetical protein